jgi:hypothetical protein
MKWRDSSAAWKSSSDKWKLSDEKKSAHISDLIAQHAIELQKLNAEMYKMHREHEEVTERIRATQIKQITSIRLTNPSEYNKVKEISISQFFSDQGKQIEQTNINEKINCQITYNHSCCTMAWFEFSSCQRLFVSNL